METRCAKVLLVGSRPYVCAQVRLSIERRPDLVVVGEASNYVGALAIAEVESPDFIVVDVAADDEGTLDYVSDLVPAAKHVLVISDICEETMLNCVRQYGAADLVPREQIAGAIIRWLNHDKKESATLTQQERVLVELVTSGLSNRTIAKRLLVSEAFVSESLASIFRKVSVRDRLELRIYCLYKGLASLE